MEHPDQGQTVSSGISSNQSTSGNRHTIDKMLCHVKEEDIDFFLDLVHEAGQIALSMRETVDIKEKTGPHDKVTTADIELSKLLVKKIGERFPNDAIVSEEDIPREDVPVKGRVWMIDPIDGTESYIRNDGQYSVMIGLLVDGQPIFGFVNVPAENATYLGGPGYGAWKATTSGSRKEFKPPAKLDIEGQTRIIMGFRDRKRHPWIQELPQVRLIQTGSIGLKVARILEDRADLFVHMSGKLKMWDTAGPVAIALAADLAVGTMQTDDLKFELPELIHETSVIIGRKGALEWCRHYLEKPVELG